VDDVNNEAIRFRRKLQWPGAVYLSQETAKHIRNIGDLKDENQTQDI
jgi:hypothetical protein